MNTILEFDTVIYHNPCNDGALALWAANYYRDIPEKIACKAGYLPNLAPEGKNILFVDLCPKFDYLFEICELATNVVVLDHHKTSWDAYELYKAHCPDNLHIVLDMSRSGCQISWDYFHQLTEVEQTLNQNQNQNQTQRPWFVDYVADRDLWTWTLPNSKEINQVFFEDNMMNPYYLDNITKLITYTHEQVNSLVIKGSQLLKYQKEQMDLASEEALEASITAGGQTYNIWLGTISSGDRSEFGNVLAKKPLKSTGQLPDFSATWLYNDKTQEWWVSLRGCANSPDLSVIAGCYEGGGHALACGFSIKYPKTLHDIFLIK
jgi:oligoribonuclease NrnB/cAMP/cGMP phosphodiesterase (DHH superfamily)